jgi:malonyl-CoA O-methyltransferase
VPEDSRPEDYRIDKRRMRSSFDRAAPGYEQVAVLQREVGERLIERLGLVRLAPGTLLDLGAGTGWVAERLALRYPRARLVALDISLAMLRGARTRAPRLARWRGRRAFVCADAERLPLADGCIDMVISNLMLQWCNDLDAALRELRRVLRPDGLLMFTSFGPDTLRELRASWAGVDGYSHVNAFIDMHDVGDALLRAGFSEPVMDREDIRLTYRDLPALMRDLKALGAHNATEGRPRGLTGPRRFARVTAAYEAWRVEGRLPATYEVVYGHCWAGAIRRDHEEHGGEVRVPLSRLARPEGGR